MFPPARLTQLGRGTHREESIMSTALVTKPAGELLPSEQTLDSMIRLAKHVADSGLAGYRATGQSVLTIALAGRELGIPFMTSVRGIHIIEGKPSPSAALIAALIYREHGDNALRVIKSTDTECTIRYRRKGWPAGEYETFTLTMADAKAHGWDQSKGGIKDNWRKFPKAMLRSRCLTIVGQDAFPDVVLGLYTPDELDADIPEAVEMVELLPDTDTGGHTEVSAASAASAGTIDGDFRDVVDPEPYEDIPSRQIDEDPDAGGEDDADAYWEEIADHIDAETVDPETGEVQTLADLWGLMATTNDPDELRQYFSRAFALCEGNAETTSVVVQARYEFGRLFDQATTMPEVEAIIDALRHPDVADASVADNPLREKYKESKKRVAQAARQMAGATA